MKQINLFYISVFLASWLLWYILLQPQDNNSFSIYGFAESNETEVNYNYPVVVEKILVTPGQRVDSAQTLLHLTRRKSKETLDDQGFRISELRAKENIWRQKLSNDIDELNLSKKTQLSEVQTEIDLVRKEISFKKSLASDLETITNSPSIFKPLEDDIIKLEEEKTIIQQTIDLKIAGIKKELAIGNIPIQEQISHLNAEKAFDASQQVIKVDVLAPSSGLVGNISCKEQEHIPSYSPLLSFYEPHSSIITGFVHEDITVAVSLGDVFQVNSLTNPELSYEGVVTGLGSRIVEIPTRLRKLASIKSYGREINLSISPNNSFLQKEKVSLTYIDKSKT